MYSKLTQTIDRDKLERRVEGVGPLIGVEELEIGNICELFKVTSYGNLVAVSCRSLESDRIVELFQTSDSDSVVAAGIDRGPVRQSDFLLTGLLFYVLMS